MDNRTRRDLGLAYIADNAVQNEMKATQKLLYAFNHTDAEQTDQLTSLAYRIIGKAGKGLYIIPPFHCDYGTHISVGSHLFINYNCTILDVASVEIGNHVLLAPNVAIYTAGHPIHPAARRSQYEYGIPVKIGDDVWIGGSAVVLPGVTIGSGSVIGAGSVVTHDIPDNVVAAGNPCRILRPITEDDKRFYYRDKKFDPEAWAAVCPE
jgi:acetyltransferase-like isoleucine patch superfamily enzyme